MQAFSDLLEQLYYTAGTKAKAQLTAMAGTLKFDFFKRNTVKKLITERVDPELFAMSYDYVGEVSETVAHLWPEFTPDKALPSLSEVVDTFANISKPKVAVTLANYLTIMTPSQRWALLKLGTRGLRIGVSARSIKQILAEYGNKDITEIEKLWHGVAPPYTDLLEWLEGNGSKPDISNAVTFHPVMLSHPIAQDDVDDFAPEQLVCNTTKEEPEKALFSRTGDDISHAFPDLLDSVSGNMVLDGELLVMHNQEVDTFNALQQRLNKKKPTAALMATNPAGLIVYDALVLDGKQLTDYPLTTRREALERFTKRASYST